MCFKMCVCEADGAEADKITLTKAEQISYYQHGVKRYDPYAADGRKSNSGGDRKTVCFI